MAKNGPGDFEGLRVSTVIRLFYYDDTNHHSENLMNLDSFSTALATFLSTNQIIAPVKLPMCYYSHL